MRVAVLTTSYPRHEGDYAGRFVADAVRRLRATGEVEFEVLGPGAYRHFGLAYGAGVMANVRRRPWKLPLLVASMMRTARSAARRNDLVHAHWFAGGMVAALARVPFVLTLHGSGTAGRFDDLGLARNHPTLFGFVMRRARVVICVSTPLAQAARAAGARDVRVIRHGIDMPAAVEPDPEAAPQVLFVGRLSPEKGVAELVQACSGLDAQLVVVGDGPLAPLVEDPVGFVAHDRLGEYYARASVVAMPSHSEGFGLVAAEAMAHARPVVASRVGGLVDLVEDGVTGLLVPPRDVGALRDALASLLADPDRRQRMGRVARSRIEDMCDWQVVTRQTIEAYASALGRRSTSSPE